MLSNTFVTSKYQNPPLLKSHCGRSSSQLNQSSQLRTVPHCDASYSQLCALEAATYPLKPSVRASFPPGSQEHVSWEVGVVVGRGSISKMYKILTPGPWGASTTWVLLCCAPGVAVGSPVHTEICTSPLSAGEQMFPTNWESKRPGVTYSRQWR